MSRFKFRLATLLRLREMARDERRAQLAQAYQAEDILAEEKRRIDTELAEIQCKCRAACSPGELDVYHLLETRRWELALRSQQQEAVTRQETVRTEIDRRRQALVETDRRVKVLENLRTRQHDRHRDKETLLEIKRLDEIATRTKPEEVRP